MGIGAYEIGLKDLVIEPNAQLGSAIDAARMQLNHTLFGPPLAAISSPPMPSKSVTQARMLEWVRTHE